MTSEPRCSVGSHDSHTPATSAYETKAASDGAFGRLDKELSRLLEIVETPRRKILKSTDPDKEYLPGHPRIRLDGAATGSNKDAKDGVLDYLRRAHLTDELDGLLPLMRYVFVQTPSYRHIMPLHHQRAHAREVIVDEYPSLHLIWHYERIFIKPIPAYFYSNAFWAYIAEADPSVHKAAVGFMRSYSLLIQYPIDFEEACALNLIPKIPDGPASTHPTYEDFCAFLRPFETINDDNVCLRYHFGELRLTRINRTAVLFRRKLAYFHIQPQWGSFLELSFQPVISVLAVATVILNSMQVTLQAQQMGPSSGENTPSGATSLPHGWSRFVSVSMYFPVVIMMLIALVIAVALLGMIVVSCRDFMRVRKSRGNPIASEKSHGMVW